MNLQFALLYTICTILFVTVLILRRKNKLLKRINKKSSESLYEILSSRITNSQVDVQPLSIGKLAYFLAEYWHSCDAKEHILVLKSILQEIGNKSKTDLGFLIRDLKECQNKQRVIDHFGNEYGTFILDNFSAYDCLSLIIDLSYFSEKESETTLGDFIALKFTQKIYKSFSKIRN